LEGKSKGADIELQLAKSLNKKIYYNLGLLILKEAL